MRLRFLGTGSAFTPGRMFSSTLLNDRILVDPSPTAPVALRYLGVLPGSIQSVLITHMHGDHFMGLPFLLLHWHYRDPPQQPVEIIAPPGGGEVIEDTIRLAYPNLIEKVNLKNILSVREVSPGESFTLRGGERIHTFKMDHAGIPAQGYLIEIEKKSVGFTGDTDICQGLTEMAESADVLVTELSSWERDIPSHLSMSKLTSIPRGPTHIFLTHTEAIPVREAVEYLRRLTGAEVFIPQDLSTYIL